VARVNVGGHLSIRCEFRAWNEALHPSGCSARFRLKAIERPQASSALALRRPSNQKVASPSAISLLPTVSSSARRQRHPSWIALARLCDIRLAFVRS